MNSNNQPLIYMLSSIYNLLPVKLDDTNYITWLFQMENMVKSLGLEGYIDGSYSPPPQFLVPDGGMNAGVTREFQEWEKNDKALMTLITATLSSEALSFVVGSNNSCEVWRNLRVRYGVSSRTAAMQLQTKLYTIQKGNDTIDKYFQRIKDITDQLASVGIHIPEEEIIIIAVNGLPSEYLTFKIVIKAQIPTMTMIKFRSLLLDEESTMDQSMKTMQNGMPTSNPVLNQRMQWNGDDIGSMVSPAVFVAQNGGGSHMFYNGGMQQHNLSIGTNGYYSKHQQLASNYKGNVSQYNGIGFFLQQPVVQHQQNGGNKNYSSQGGVSQLPDISNQGFGGFICNKLGHDHLASVNKFNQVMGDYKIRDDRKAQASIPVVDIRVSNPRASSPHATGNPREATTVQTSVPRASSTPASYNPSQVTSASVTSASSAKQEPQLIDEFDPRDSVSGGPFGSVSAAPPNSNNAAMDLLGSLLSAIVPSVSTSTTFEGDGIVNSAPVTTFMATPPDTTMLNCRHASYPLKLCQSLPLIPPG